MKPGRTKVLLNSGQTWGRPFPSRRSPRDRSMQTGSPRDFQLRCELRNYGVDETGCNVRVVLTVNCQVICFGIVLVKQELQPLSVLRT